MDSRKGNFNFKCIVCGKSFKAWKYQKRKYCSRECLYENQRLNLNKGNFLYRKKFGIEHPKWNPEPEYSTLHQWVNRYKEKNGICGKCHAETTTDWANLSGEYKRNLDDYIELCRKCHYWFDGQLEKMYKNYGLDFFNKIGIKGRQVRYGK